MRGCANGKSHADMISVSTQAGRLGGVFELNLE